MVATSGANAGVLATLAMIPTPARAMPIPTTAVTIGRPMATTDPNAISRMTMAASKPNASDAGMAPVWNGLPPNSTSTPLARSD